MLLIYMLSLSDKATQYIYLLKVCNKVLFSESPNLNRFNFFLQSNRFFFVT